MKRLFAVALVFALALSLCACGKTNEPCTEHVWGDWQMVKESTDFTPGRLKWVCNACGAEEFKDDFYRMFMDYGEIIRWLPFFTEAERLQQNLDSVITAAFFGGVAHETEANPDEGIYYHTVKVSDLNDFTTKVFGCTYDYTGVENMYVLFESKASYDADLDAVVIRAMGAGNEMPMLTDVSYEVTASSSYMVTAYYEFYGEVTERVFCVAEKNGNYVISTY